MIIIIIIISSQVKPKIDDDPTLNDIPAENLIDNLYMSILENVIL